MAARLAALTLLLWLPLHAQAARQHAFRVGDVDSIARVGNPVLSPHGATVAYTVTTTDPGADRHATTIWTARWDGTGALQMTQPPQSATAPAFSPDGRYLSFLATAAEGGASQVWVLDRRGGGSHQLTHTAQPVTAYRWSPDSKRLLLTLEDGAPPSDSGKPRPIVVTRYAFLEDGTGFLTSQRSHVYLLTLTTGKLDRLLQEPDNYEEQSAEWSPDGRSIAFVSQRDQPDPERTENADVYVTASAPFSTPRRLTHFAGVNQGPLAWSPDGQTLAYRQARVPGYSSYEQPQLAVVPAAGGLARVLTSGLNRRTSQPVFTLDGTQLLTTVVDDGNQYVAAVDVHDGSLRRLTKGNGVVTAIASRAGHTMVEWSNDTSFPELYALAPDGALRKLTHQNDALLASVHLVAAQNLTARSKDGSVVHGLLAFPADAAPRAKLPMLLYIHGGPDSQDAHDFTLTRQVFAGHGYAVLNVNYRGSDGRGYAWSHAIQADWGNKEVADLLAMVDAAVATGRIDPNRIGVGGWSYGAILTEDLIATTHRFRAASAGAGRANLLGVYGTNEWTLQYDEELGKPWKDTALYLRLSYPFLHADRIHTPTLFMGGDRDVNVPLAGSEQMYEALQSVGTPAQLIIYPGQTHVFTRPSFIRDRYQRWLDWYDHYLQPQETLHAP